MSVVYSANTSDSWSLQELLLRQRVAVVLIVCLAAASPPGARRQGGDCPRRPLFRCAATLAGDHSTLGLIATNTIAQGDTRSTGLQHLVVHESFDLYAATRSMPWPGAEAAVTVAVAHLAGGNPTRHLPQRILDGQPAQAVNSRLRAKPERPDPQKLPEKAGLSFVGSYVLGMGFVLTPEERADLIAKNPTNDERIFPYLGGEEVNTSPTQSPHRFVISFGQMPLDQAEQWPDLLTIVRERVKPERDRNKREVRRRYWWRFGEVAPALYEAIAPLPRCVVTAIVSKHLIFAFQPAERIFSHKLFVFPLTTVTAWAVLQSRLHTAWTWLLSSTLEERLNYSATDCLETFPFPTPNPRDPIPALETAGQRLHDARQAYMQETQTGLTATYNQLKDPTAQDDRILALRRLHEDLDRAVLTAYRWQDLQVPPYCPLTPTDHQALTHFEDEVLDRLFQLNADKARKNERSLCQLSTTVVDSALRRSSSTLVTGPISSVAFLATPTSSFP